MHYSVQSSKIPKFEIFKAARFQDSQIPRLQDSHSPSAQDPKIPEFPNLKFPNSMFSKTIFYKFAHGILRILKVILVYSNSQTRVPEGSPKFMKIEVFETSIRQNGIWPVPHEAE